MNIDKEKIGKHISKQSKRLNNKTRKETCRINFEINLREKKSVNLAFRKGVDPRNPNKSDSYNIKSNGV